MSGGSFDYLFVADSPQEAAQKSGALREMADALETEAPGHPVTKYTRELADRQSEEIPPDVREVWHAVEWRYSGDWGQDQLDKALEATKQMEMD